MMTPEQMEEIAAGAANEYAEMQKDPVLNLILNDAALTRTKNAAEALAQDAELDPESDEAAERDQRRNRAIAAALDSQVKMVNQARKLSNTVHQVFAEATGARDVTTDVTPDVDEPEEPFVTVRKPHWYEFDWLYDYRDFIGVLGFGVIVAGVAVMLGTGAALIVGGLVLVAIAYALASTPPR